MEIHQLRYFLAVYREKSFTRGAAACNVSQPSLSAQIAKLEDELGGKLFERTRRGVALTERGEVFRPHALEILHRLEQAVEDAQSLDGLRRGRVRLGCLPTTGAYLLPAILSEFGKAHPEIVIELREESSPGLARALTDFAVDLAILDQAGLEGNFHGDRLFEEPLLLAVPPNHPLAARKSLALAELSGVGMILMKPGFGFQRIVTRALASAGVVPKVVYESAEIETVQALVAAGLGVSIVPAMVRLPSGIAYLELTSPSPSRTLSLACRSVDSLSPAAAALRACILKIYS